MPVPAHETDPLAGWYAASLSSAVTMWARELRVCCLHLPRVKPLRNIYKWECVEGKVKNREKCRKVFSGSRWAGKKKKKKSSVREMRQRRLWSFSLPARRAAAVWGFHCEAEKCCWWWVCFPRLGAAAHEDTWAHTRGNVLPSLEAWDGAHYALL